MTDPLMTPHLKALISAGLVTSDGTELTDRGQDAAEARHFGEDRDPFFDDTPHGFGVDDTGN